MKKLNFRIYYSIIVFIFIACNSNEKKSDIEISTVEKTSVANEALPDLSMYNLPSEWTTQENQQIHLEDLRGNVVVMVMIYTSCKAACPRLVADMRNIETKFSEDELENLKFVLVSIDPETDTPERLAKFAEENEMTDDHWLFLRSNDADTREFAAVLAVNYKQISPIDFSHSNIISVFDEDGVLVHQQEGLGVDNTETIEAIKQEMEN